MPIRANKAAQGEQPMTLTEQEETMLAELSSKVFELPFGVSADQGAVYEAMKSVLLKRLAGIEKRKEAVYEP